MTNKLPKILIASFLFGFLIPNNSFAAHTCSVEPFSQTIIQGEQAAYTINLKSESLDGKFEIKTGNLPNNVEGGFVAPSVGDVNPKNVLLVFNTSLRSQVGPMSIAVFYTQEDGDNLEESKCLLELVVQKKIQENRNYYYQAPTKNVPERINIDSKRLVPKLSTLQKKVANTVQQNEISVLNTEKLNQPFFTQRLVSGSWGDKVLKLQNLLKDLGYFPKEEESTKYFGVLTKKAVQMLQKENNLEQVGELGPKTREILNKMIKN